MASVFTRDFERWADSRVGSDSLGEFLIRLIHSGVPLQNINVIRYLSDDSNNLTGWDGILDIHVEHPHLPNGRSVWEVSGRTNPTGKIRDDFAKRLTKPLPADWDQGETTYVAVTLRKLDDPMGMEDELKEDSPWRDVKVIDAVTLQEWVSLYPSVEAWLHEREIGNRHSIRRLSAVWEEWSLESNPQMSLGLVRAGRSKIIHELRTQIIGPADVINIRSESPDEIIGFVHATAYQEKDKVRDYILSRCIVINNVVDIERLKSLSPQIVILLGAATQKAITTSRYGHTVINAIGNSSPTFKIDYVLERSSREEFRSNLIEMGIEEREADIQAKACGNSPSLWRVWNQLNTGDPAAISEWMQDDNPTILIPAVMMGGWSEDKEGDIEIVKLFTNMEYNEYKERLEQIQAQNHPPLVKIADVWSAIAPAVSFAMLTPQITSVIMGRFTEIVSTVFSELDPTLELSPDERPYASLHNKEMKYSSWLREGLAETILRIAVVGEALDDTGKIPGGVGRQDYVNSLINGLEGLKTDARLIISLRHQLPVLAEAAPIPFFEALEELIQGNSEDLAMIFEEGESGFGHSFYHHFLWALERLAWSPSFLMRSSKLLVSLASIDTGGMNQNRPTNSLKEIFLPWMPDTSATLQQREEVLTTIINDDYDVGWNLLLELLPSFHGASSPTNKPQWRDFGQTERNRPNKKDVFLTYDWLIQLAITHVGKDVGRLLDLMKHYSMFSYDRKHEFNARLIEFSKIENTTDQKGTIWKVLRDLIYRHRSYKDAEWAMSDSVLTELEGILELFIPTNPLDNAKWLFDDQYPSIPIPSDDFDSIDAELKRLRYEAIQDVYQNGGTEGIIDLADNVQFVYLLAIPIIDQFEDMHISMDLISEAMSDDDKRRNFVASLSEACYRKFGMEWNQLLIATAAEQGWSANQIAQAVLYYPDTIETYDIIDSQGAEVAADYWKRRHGYIRSDDNTVLIRGIEQLYTVGRYIDIIALTPKKLKILQTSRIIELLDNAVEELNAGAEFQRGGDIGYYIELLISWLREKEDCPLEDLARLEYRYLTLLTRGLKKPNLAIHKVIAEDPEFFIMVICDLYKPKSASEEDEEIDEELAEKASQAWKLLQSWGTPPGLDEQGRVDKEKLTSWVTQSIELATEKDRLDIAKEHIGKVLFYLPVDSKTGGWPCAELSELLESLKDTVIEGGILYAQIDSRGGTSKAMFEGGKQEREIAASWRSKLEDVDEKWVRMRALINRIAEYWERDAKREDERAKKDRLRFS